MTLAIGCAAIFALGLYGVLTRRDLIAIVVSAELMIGAANVQLVALALSRGADGAFVSSFAPCAHDGATGSAAAMISRTAAMRAVLQIVEGFARIYRFSGKLPSRQKLTCQRSS